MEWDPKAMPKNPYYLPSFDAGARDAREDAEQKSLFDIGPAHPKAAEEKVNAASSANYHNPTEAGFRAIAAAHKEAAASYKAHPELNTVRKGFAGDISKHQEHETLAKMATRDAETARVNSHPSTVAADKLSNRARYGGGLTTVTPKSAYKAAGEAHLQAAKDNPENSYHHLNEAAEMAKSAGGEWDDSKHPRDSNGKFT